LPLKNQGPTGILATIYLFRDRDFLIVGRHKFVGGFRTSDSSYGALAEGPGIFIRNLGVFSRAVHTCYHGDVISALGSRVHLPSVLIIIYGRGLYV
jgi:hypothetical protein